MLQSMTGFATVCGVVDGSDWTIDLKSVNSKTLDLRFRLPDWLGGLEPDLRGMLAKSLSRGSVQVSLKVNKAAQNYSRELDSAALGDVFEMAKEFQDLARHKNVEIAPLQFSDVLSLNGVVQRAELNGQEIALKEVVLSVFPQLIDDLIGHRQAEGAALEKILRTSLAALSDTLKMCGKVLKTRESEFESNFKKSLARLGQNTMEPERLVQEMAILAVKSDVTEELDRLAAHVGAAQELLDAGSPIGRKFDFLMQEFNREANTLCSKSGSKELTQLGLDMKVTIDQMREQVQNVE